MKILKETPRYSDGTRIVGDYDARIQLDDGERIELCDAEGKLIVRVDIGVLAQRPTHCINAWIPDSRKVRHISYMNSADITCVMINTDPQT